MRFGVVDVGSNTTRLLVARVEGGEIVREETGRVRLALGEEIERTGVLSEVAVTAAAKAVRKLCGLARRRGVETLDVFVTAPGRQSGNAEALLAALARAAGQPVRVLSTDEEGRLAYAGAVATAWLPLPATIAVCDVGGASTEIAVGAPDGEPDWIRSVGLGSVRLTTRAPRLSDAQAEAAAAFAGVDPPWVEAALVVGGSARAARRLVGGVLGAAELEEALRLVERTPAAAISRRYDIHRSRVRILLGGIVVLAEVRSRLGVPLHVCDGGIREGAALAAVARRAA